MRQWPTGSLRRPNVIRRVLELFLAFKVPGTHPMKDKLQSLSRSYTSLDKVRMVALERLSQVESHSDAMEDFIAHSSMTIEEVRDANAALLESMEAADENHTKAIRREARQKRSLHWRWHLRNRLGCVWSSARAPLRPEFRGTRQKGFQCYPVGTHEELALGFE
jgi:FtsZ-binding cell division protein ZapB